MDPAQGTPQLAVTGLTVRYPGRRSVLEWAKRIAARPVVAVDEVSLIVNAGEILALVGESGCGKTSLAETVLRLTKESAGAIELDGRELTQLSNHSLRQVRRTMQFIPQDPYESLDARMRVRDLVEEPLIVHGLGSTKEARLRNVIEALDRVGLRPARDFLDRYPHELSGGQRQRVVIASAMILRPKLLIADEPVSMLDVSVRAGILELLAELRRADGLAILMITHDLSTAAHFADRVAVMYLGRIVEEGPARQVIRDPRHPYTRALVNAVPRRSLRGRPPIGIVRGEPPDPTRIPTGCRFRSRCVLAESRCAQVDPTLDSYTEGSRRAACIKVEIPAPAPSTEGVTT